MDLPHPTQTAQAQNPFREEFSLAAEYAGVPKSWANNRAVLQLVRKESSFDPAAKNPTSTAWGLFQLLRGTWEQFVPEIEHGIEDAFWQAVGGFRYINSRYGTPERALAFWEATYQRNPALAPKDLRGKVDYWIARGFVGY